MLLVLYLVLTSQCSSFVSRCNILMFFQIVGRLTKLFNDGGLNHFWDRKHDSEHHIFKTKPVKLLYLNLTFIWAKLKLLINIPWFKSVFFLLSTALYIK